MSKTSYVVYPAVFDLEDDSDFEGVYHISFPDVPGCLTFGNGLDEAMRMAQDALGLMLHDETDLPKPSSLEAVQKNFPGQLVNYVGVNLEEAAKAVKVVTVKKNTSIPADLARQGEVYGLNFSALLTRALRSEIERLTSSPQRKAGLTR